MKGMDRPSYVLHDRNLDVATIVGTPDMAERGKICTNGGSQAVRLPRSVRSPQSQREAIVRKSGKRVILEAAGEWPADFLKVLGSCPDEIERPKQQPISKTRNPFD